MNNERSELFIELQKRGINMTDKPKNKILIVDDDRANLIYLNTLLGAEFTLYMAKNGAQALKRAADNAPDLILLDIVMPGMNGYEVLTELKKSQITRDIPVIFITGLNSDDDETKGLESGADDYISKPFNDAIVLLRIKNQLKIINQMRLIIKKEIAEKSSRAKSEFLSRMNHELRTPMNAIIGMTTLAKNTDDPAKKNAFLEKSAAASHDLLRLVEDVLDISDLNDGSFKLGSSEFRFHAVMRGELRKAERLFAAKDQTLIAEVDPSVPDILIGDERRLAQVIENLLSNAGKFTPNGGTVTIAAKAVENADGFLTARIDVTDDGVGIPADKQAAVFSAFEQADGGISRKYGGAGMGLYLSKTVVEMMGGAMWFTSAPGVGSTFSFTFKSKIGRPDAGAGAPASFAGVTMLLVDDVDINREIVIALLEETQMNFVCAENGREAVELYGGDPAKFDIVFMDINMPVMDGVEATRRIRSLGAPECARVPIIAITANTNPDEVESYLAAGMDDHLGKPADFEKIIRMIDLYVAGREKVVAA